MPSPVRPGPAPAVTDLVRRGVEYTLHPYDVGALDDEVGVAELLDVEPERVLEVVVVEAGGRVALCVVPDGAELDEAGLARALGAPVRVASETVAERATGQPSDAVSPFGRRRALPTVVDRSVAAMGRRTPGLTVYVASGQVGLAVEVALADLLRLVGGTEAPAALPLL